MENDLSLIVRRVLLEAPTGGSGDSESGGFTPEERDQAMGAIFVTGAIVYYIVSALGLGAVALVGSLIEKIIADRDFQTSMSIYRRQSDGSLKIEVVNNSKGPVSIQRIFGGFLFPERYSDKDAPPIRDTSDLTGRYADGKTVGYFRGGQGKINLKSLLTGKPHPDALVIGIGDKIGAQATQEVTADVTSVSSNLDVDFEKNPISFMPTHALIRTARGADLMIPVVYKRIGGKFIVVVDDRMASKADKREDKRISKL